MIARSEQANAADPFQTLGRLSLAAPAYNEAGSIVPVLDEWLRYLAGSRRVEAFEIVVCNDGSSDATGALLAEAARGDARVKPVQFERNQGAAAALAEAIRHTTLDWVLLIDSDGQFAIDNLDAMLDAVAASGALAAIGVRRKSDSSFARFGTWSSGLVCNAIYGTKYRDFNSAFKLVYGPLLRALVLEAKGLNYSTEVTAKLLERRIPLVEVEVVHLPRRAGKSSLKMVRGALHRLGFVGYLAYRRLLQRSGVLVTPK